MQIAELRRALELLQRLYSAAGSQGPAKDLAILSDMLSSFDVQSVEVFCAAVRNGLLQPVKKAATRKKPGTAISKSMVLNIDAISRHLARLQNAGTDRQEFDSAFHLLKADKSLKSADVGEIARRYSDSVTKYKSISAAQADISRAFVRQARFASKLV